MRILITILSIAILSGCTMSKNWTKQERNLEYAWVAMHLVDWATTRDVAANQDKFEEYNPVLGKHPTMGEVDTYMGASIIAHTLITNMMPRKYVFGNRILYPRKYWQHITIGVKGGTIANNLSVGCRVRF